MLTCAVIGQAAGTMAAHCLTHGIRPGQLHPDHTAAVQQTLLRHDVFVPGVANADPNDLARVFGLFPRLEERKNQIAGTMSGGEQQMLAIGRALMARPSVLLLDEPSLGLSPILVDTIFQIILDINAQGTTVLLVEQNALKALAVANRGYVIQTGHIVLSGTAKELLGNDMVRKAYLGEE